MYNIYSNFHLQVSLVRDKLDTLKPEGGRMFVSENNMVNNLWAQVHLFKDTLSIV